MNPVGTFSWNPTVADISGSPYLINIEIVNDACPVPGSFSFQYQIILTESDVIITPSINDPSCNGLSNGSINTIITGLNTPFNYSWSNGQTSAIITVIDTAM